MASASNLTMCTRCGKVASPSDFMNDNGNTFKWCSDCRARGRARSHLRRQRKKDILDSFRAQAEANPQLTQYIFGELATTRRSAFSRRNPIRLLLNPPSAPTLPDAQTSETLSTSLKTEDTESTISESEQAEPSRTSHNLYFPPLDPFDDTPQPDPQVKAEEEPGETPSVSIPASTPAYFFCVHCSIPRKIGLGYNGICVYCLEHEQQYCMAGDHEADRPLFLDADGMEQSSCRNCRQHVLSDDEMELFPGSDDE